MGERRATSRTSVVAATLLAVMAGGCRETPPPPATSVAASFLECWGETRQARNILIDIIELTNGIGRPEAQLERARTLLRASHAPRDLVSAMNREVARADPALLSAHLAWCDTPVGRRYAAAIRNETRFEGEPAVHLPEDPVRLGHLRRLSDAWRYHARSKEYSGAEIATAVMALELAREGNAVGRARGSLISPAVRAHLERTAQKITESVIAGLDPATARENVLGGLAFQVRDLDDADLVALADYAGTDAGRRATDLWFASVLAALEEARTRLLDIEG